jgi:hypothetical protein
MALSRIQEQPLACLHHTNFVARLGFGPYRGFAARHRCFVALLPTCPVCPIARGVVRVNAWPTTPGRPRCPICPDRRPNHFLCGASTSQRVHYQLWQSGTCQRQRNAWQRSRWFRGAWFRPSASATPAPVKGEAKTKFAPCLIQFNSDLARGSLFCSDVPAGGSMPRALKPVHKE